MKQGYIHRPCQKCLENTMKNMDEKEIKNSRRGVEPWQWPSLTFSID